MRRNIIYQKMTMYRINENPYKGRTETRTQEKLIKLIYYIYIYIYMYVCTITHIILFILLYGWVGVPHLARTRTFVQIGINS